LIFGFLGILILFVVASGSASSTLLKFSDGIISFNYPSDFQNITFSGNITSESSNLIDKTHMANRDNIAIVIGKNLQANSAANARDATLVSFNKISTDKVFSTTTETNPNSIVVEKSITQLIDPNTNTVLKCIDMFFTANGVVYHISVYGDDSKNQQIIETADTIFNSLK